jgi:hypothetical protein
MDVSRLPIETPKDRQVAYKIILEAKKFQEGDVKGITEIFLAKKWKMPPLEDFMKQVFKLTEKAAAYTLKMDMERNAVEEKPKDDKKYNGHASYETWLAYTWLTSDEESYRMAGRLSYEELKDFICSLSDGLDGLLADLANAAISEINFYELHKSLQDEEGL